jgi:hypothetical protein
MAMVSRFMHAGRVVPVLLGGLLLVPGSCGTLPKGLLFAGVAILLVALMMRSASMLDRAK